MNTFSCELVFERQRSHFAILANPRQDDFPNSMRLDLSLLRYRRATEVTLKARSFAALGKDGGGQRLCTDRPGVTFTKCVDIEYSKRLLSFYFWQKWKRISACPSGEDARRLGTTTMTPTSLGAATSTS